MKKILFLTAFSLIFSPMLANAETILVVDQNNIVRQQIYTQPMGQQVVVQQPQPVYVQPQQVVVQQPAQTVVVRQHAPRTYYYDSVATGMLAGFTGAVIGHALFGHHHGGHHHRH
ncbi:MAG: hypothetical protein IJ770_03885 [Alphaproteobacteria bacterium]|nr:hypothetical protein [Alphaproteobacteria bacterium]